MTPALPKVIYIMGPPGAGKGTQAKLLAGKLSYIQFSTGDAFREVSRQKTALGQRVKATIDNGFLAPPDMAAEIVIQAVAQHLQSGRGVIFDGTPRTVAEAAIVDEYFSEQGLGQPLVIYLKVDRQEMIERNSKRNYCLGITGDFPVVTNEDRERCKAQGGTIGRRPDDDQNKMSTRWDQFMKHTFPVINSYQQHNMVHEIDGLSSVDEVQSSIMSIIDLYKR